MKTLATHEQDDPLVTSSWLRSQFGDISSMTVWRWRRAGILPEPVVIRGRNYWRRSAALAAVRAATGDEPDAAA